MRRAQARATAAATAAAALLCAGLGPAADAGEGGGPPLYTAGIGGTVGGPLRPLAVAPGAFAHYVPGTAVLVGPDGAPLEGQAARPDGYRRQPAPGLGQLVAASRSWLADGTVPGRTAAERELAARALLDLALLTAPDGGSVAAAFGPWNLVWPRDAGWHAAAFAVTGHLEEAHAILAFLARVQDADGTWAARYTPGGRPVSDGRPRQLDATGWVPWAAWMWWRAGGDIQRLRGLWPMVARAAGAAAAALREDGLPRASADYWEQREHRRTLGTAAPLLVGLRAATDLAGALGRTEERREWAAAARRLDSAVTATFGATGYRRYPDARSGPDAAVAFLAAPLAPTRPAVARALQRTAGELLMPSGGLRPGDIPRVGGVAWTPSTALFALAAAAAGDETAFRRWFGWLAAHRTVLGALPEKVRDDGSPASVAPLGWTCSIVLLALAARDGRVPTPPVPSRPGGAATLAR